MFKADLPIQRQSEILNIKLIIIDAAALTQSGILLNWKSIISELRRKGYLIACTSELSFNEALGLLGNLNIANLFEYVLARGEYKRCKPSPEVYYRCCMNFGLSPRQVLVLDSNAAAATSSGCHVFKGRISIERITNQIELINEVQESNPLITQWQQSIQIIIPLMDAEDEFTKAGFGYPAPLVEVNGRLMLQNLVENLNMTTQLIFVLSREMYEKHNMKYFLETLSTDPIKLVLVDKVEKTEMKFCAQILASKGVVDLNQPVIVTSCSQFLEWDSNSFLYSLANPLVDAGLLTFQNTHPRYAYVSLDERGWVTGCELFKPISSHACAGIFYWKNAFDLYKYCAIVVTKGIDTFDKFSVILAYREAVKDGKRIKNYQCRRMWELSTPTDLDYFHMVQNQ